MRILLAALLAGCAALEQDLAPARNSWQGASYDEVARSWGAPARSDGQTHTWVSEGYRRVAPSVGIVVGSGGSGIFGSIPFGNTGEPVRCDRTMVFRDGAVAEQSWRGPADYCKTFTRLPQ